MHLLRVDCRDEVDSYLLLLRFVALIESQLFHESKSFLVTVS